MCEESKEKTLVALRAASHDLTVATKMVVQLRQAHSSIRSSHITLPLRSHGDLVTQFDTIKAVG